MKKKKKKKHVALMPDNGTRARKSKSYTSRSKLIPQSKMNNLALDIPGIISRNTA